MIQKPVIGLPVGRALIRIRQVERSPEFERLMNTAVRQMITMVKADNERTWREAAKKGSYGRKIYEALRSETGKYRTQIAIQSILDENAKLIRTVPQRTANELVKMIFKETQKGYRASEVMERVVEDAPFLSPRQAMLIARTEASKANAVMTQVRCEELGADWYFWRSSHDERVRSSHQSMDGVLIRWSDPPDPEKLNGEGSKFGAYQAGCCPNCRCYAEPLIDESQIPNMVRVYAGGEIEKMSKKAFLRLSK